MNKVAVIEALAELDHMLRELNKVDRVWDNTLIAIGEAAGAIKREDADGCTVCKFTDFEEWDLPCKICKRNSKDYWRARDDKAFHPTSCDSEATEWADEEYIEPADWSKVPIDTPILVKAEEEDTKWYRRYFAGVDEYGYVMAWDDGRTSWSVYDQAKVSWECAKLVEVEND